MMPRPSSARRCSRPLPATCSIELCCDCLSLSPRQGLETLGFVRSVSRSIALQAYPAPRWFAEVEEFAWVGGIHSSERSQRPVMLLICRQGPLCPIIRVRRLRGAPAMTA
jgi:hypothetical protein